jgi:hypothetical protein
MFLVAAAMVGLADHGGRHPGKMIALLEPFMDNQTLLLIWPSCCW